MTFEPCSGQLYLSGDEWLSAVHAGKLFAVSRSAKPVTIQAAFDLGCELSCLGVSTKLTKQLCLRFLFGGLGLLEMRCRCISRRSVQTTL